MMHVYFSLWPDKAIRLFLTYASLKILWCLDGCQGAFSFGKIEEEIYVCQPKDFEDPDFPDRVYKVEKALYGLHQAPRACKANGGWVFVYQSRQISSNQSVTLHAAKELLILKRFNLKLGLLVSKRFPFDLVAYTDSDYAGASLDRKSTTGGCQFIRCRLISWQCKKQTVVANSTTEAEYVEGKADLKMELELMLVIQNNLLLVRNVNAASITYSLSLVLQALVDGKKIVVTEASVRRDLQLDEEEGTDCLPNATIFEELTRMGRSKRKDTEVPQPSDPTNVADEAANKEPTQEITSLKKRVKKLEKKGGSRTHKLRRLYKVGRSARVVSSDEASLDDQEDASKQGRKIDDIDADIDITLVNDVVNDQDMFDVNDLAGEEVFIIEQRVSNSKKDDATQVNTAVTTVSTASIIPVRAATITEDEITLAQALAELKSVKPKVTTATTTTTKGILLQEPSESITTTTTTIPSKDKGKGIMVEEPLQMKKKDQISFDEQEAIRLQAEFDEEVRLAREKDEANVALIEEWNDIQAKIETDYELAQRLQAEEQEELTVDEKATLFQQLLEKRRKHFAAKRAEEKRNRPPTRAQQRSIMCTYLKNMAGWKPKDLKSKSFTNIQELIDKAFKRVDTFVDFRTELVEGTEMEESSKKEEVMEESSKKAKIAQESSSKRAGDELEQENAKK
ncbi:ribonuclease H-like domain, reverse transcriptase, RNA-dependent DNA polymerase [Tanacetum coccineum]